MENNDYLIEETIQKNILKTIEDKYNEKMINLRKVNEKGKKDKKVEQGIIAQKVMIENIQNKRFNRIASDYIDALLYMPGVNYKKIHKYILGCCLQKIDKNFKADNDLYTNSRKDLIDIKKKFATRKETNKKRYMRFSPLPDEKKDNIRNDISFLRIDNYSVALENDKNKVKNWLNTMYDKNPLFPNDVIEIFKDNSRKSLGIVEKYIKILQTTSRNKNSDFEKYFMSEKVNYKTILLKLMKILNEYNEDDENVLKLLQLSSESIKNILIELDVLNDVINPENMQDINRINLYICARALCLPCNPELSVNNTLKCLMITPQNYIEENARNIHNSILSSLKYSTFPTVEEITNFLNTKREENKQIKLSILNNKTVEENQLIGNLKKAGIINNLMEIDENMNDDYKAEDDIEEIDFEEEDEEKNDD